MRLRGFTLIELIVVMGILAILATIVVIAVNPGKQFATSRNAKRANDVRAIAQALQQHASDNNGNVYASITTTPQIIGTSNLNLAPILVPNYLAAIPKDPSNGTDADTKYTVYLDNNSRVVVRAVSAELNRIVESTGVSNYALSFDGTDDYVDTGNDFSWGYNNSFTLSVWFKPNGAAAGRAFIGKTNWEYVFKQHMWEIYMGYFDTTGSGGYVVSGGDTRTLPSGQWALATATYDASTRTVTTYLNGQQVASGIAPNVTYQDRTETTKIGSGYSATSFNSELDDVRIFNRALSASEVAQLYNGAAISTTGLVGFWNFNEGRGTTTADSSGSNYTGTLTNGPTWVPGR